jgi:hypothetical protein
MTRLRFFGVFMVLALGSGCGGAGTGSVDSTATGTDFCRSMVDETVTAVARRYVGSDDWRDHYTSSVLCDQVDGLIAAGTLTYDRASGEDCLTHLRQLDCIDIRLPESCTDAIAGRLPAGSQCFFLEHFFSDCAPGNYCEGSGNACGGTCKPYVQPGGSCAYTLAGEFPGCASGLSCPHGSNLCTPYVGEGESCLDASAGNCGDGLYCNGVACQKRKTSGTCRYGGECAAGYVCAGPTNTRTCTKVKLPGDSCTQGQSECYGLSFCGDDGKCTRTGVAEDQPCGTNLQGEYIQCGTHLYCGWATPPLVDPSVGIVGGGTCQRTKPAGSPCSYWTECAGKSAYCDSATSLCVTCD